MGVSARSKWQDEIEKRLGEVLAGTYLALLLEAYLLKNVFNVYFRPIRRRGLWVKTEY